MITIGSLFAGIGGLELGIERAIRAHGHEARVIWQAERDQWCRRVLESHWPKAERIVDVRYVQASRVLVPDIVCGGFPCQDISLAGTGKGLDGERSGLWKEFARVVSELRPRFVVVENVAALRRRGLGVVLGHFSACGYDATWDCVPASAVGAPHRRDRLFVVAWRVSDAIGDELRDQPERGQGRASSAGDGGDAKPRDVGEGGRTGGGPEGSSVADAACEGFGENHPGDGGEPADGRTRLGGARSEALADTDLWRREAERVANRERGHEGASGDIIDGCDLSIWPPGPADVRAWRELPTYAQPAVCALANGIPPDMVRPALRATGNAVVVPVGEVVGGVLMAIRAGLQ